MLYIQHVSNNDRCAVEHNLPPVQKQQGRARRKVMSEFEKTCTYCKAKIKLSDKQDKKWLPYNLDGSSHDCRTKQETPTHTLEAVQKKLESIGIIINVERLMK